MRFWLSPVGAAPRRDSRRGRRSYSKIVCNDWIKAPTGKRLPVSLDVASFASLAPTATPVFITGNEINFLTFPQVPERIGFGWVEAALAALAVGPSKQVIKEL